MGVMASQIISFTIVYSTVYSGASQRKHQSSASLAFERGIRRWLVNSPYKWPVTRKMFPFDDVIMLSYDVDANSGAKHYRWLQSYTMQHIPSQLILVSWCHMATQILVNIGSGNGLLLQGTKLLPKPNRILGVLLLKPRIHLGLGICPLSRWMPSRWLRMAGVTPMIATFFTTKEVNPRLAKRHVYIWALVSAGWAAECHQDGYEWLVWRQW